MPILDNINIFKMTIYKAGIDSLLLFKNFFIEVSFTSILPINNLLINEILNEFIKLSPNFTPDNTSVTSIKNNLKFTWRLGVPINTISEQEAIEKLEKEKNNLKQRLGLN